MIHSSWFYGLFAADTEECAEMDHIFQSFEIVDSLHLYHLDYSIDTPSSNEYAMLLMAMYGGNVCVILPPFSLQRFLYYWKFSQQVSDVAEVVMTK